MIIDGNSVQGIYVYTSESSQIEFEKGDFLVSGDCIYICTAENPTNPINGTVSGIDPADDIGYENFIPYPGSKILSASEFFQYVENSDTLEDKYVSSQAIMGILQGYQFGVGMTGVIEDYIDRDGNSKLGLDSVTNDPLDNLMLTKTLNNGIIKVSHELSQIADGELNGVPFSTLFGYLENSGVDYNLILHQYTYEQKSSGYVRIQEMSSPLTGVSVYRFMTWEGDEFPEVNSVISSWRTVYSYSSAVMDKLRALSDFYQESAARLRAKINSLRGSFRFKELASSYGTSFTVSNPTGPYTVCLQGYNASGKIVSESVVLRLNGGYDMYFNNLPGHLNISVSGSTYTVSLRDSASTSIVSVYTREVL